MFQLTGRELRRKSKSTKHRVHPEPSAFQKAKGRLKNLQRSWDLQDRGTHTHTHWSASISVRTFSLQTTVKYQARGRNMTSFYGTSMTFSPTIYSVELINSNILNSAEFI